MNTALRIALALATLASLLSTVALAALARSLSQFTP